MVPAISPPNGYRMEADAPAILRRQSGLAFSALMVETDVCFGSGGEVRFKGTLKYARRIEAHAFMVAEMIVGKHVQYISTWKTESEKER